MVVTIRCKLLQCFGVPVTLSCIYKQYLDIDVHTHMRKREKFSIAETQSLSFTEE